MRSMFINLFDIKSKRMDQALSSAVCMCCSCNNDNFRRPPPLLTACQSAPLMHASFAHAHELTRQLNSRTKSLLQNLLWLCSFLVDKMRLRFVDLIKLCKGNTWRLYYEMGPACGKHR